MGRVEHHIGAKVSPEREIAALAARQHGVVSRDQLIAAGLSRRSIARRTENGSLRRLHRGVFAVGYEPGTKLSLLMAALLATGPGSAVSHRAAAELWTFMDGPSPVEVSAPRSRDQIPGVIVHRPRLLESDVTDIQGLRVTTVARTLIDLCSCLTASHVARLCNEAQIRRLVTREELAEVLGRSYGRRGINKLRRLARDETPPTRSQLEKRFVKLVADAGLPPPRMNEYLLIDGRKREVDAHWPDLKLAVELDSWKIHGVPHQFESDRKRDIGLVIDGWRVVRVTWARLRDDRAGVVEDLRRLIDAPGLS